MSPSTRTATGRPPGTVTGATLLPTPLIPWSEGRLEAHRALVACLERDRLSGFSASEAHPALVTIPKAKPENRQLWPHPAAPVRVPGRGALELLGVGWDDARGARLAVTAPQVPQVFRRDVTAAWGSVNRWTRYHISEIGPQPWILTAHWLPTSPYWLLEQVGAHALQTPNGESWRDIILLTEEVVL